MDYEKKYKEALEGAKKIIEYYKEHHRCDETSIEDLESIFPELKESEDERIRKELIEHCKNQAKPYIDTGNECPQIQSWIVWIEKQRDKDKLIQELGEYKVKYTQEVLEKHINSISNKDDERLRRTTIAFLKDFAEQGYENAVECIDWIGKQGKQKPAEWSEDDEKMLADACIMLDWYQGNNWWKAQHIKNWLKALKQRIGG